MMLASPLIPQRPFSPVANDDHLSFRPARDVESFNSLLPPPIEFVEGSSSGALAVPEGKYQPINASPKLGLKDRTDNPSLLSSKSAAPPVVTTASANASSSTSLQSPNSSTSTLQSTSTGLGAKTSSIQPTVVNVDLSWPESCDRASGLYNVGNTCFLNSALQCLLHTPPLLRMVISHGREKCKAAEKFCMVCNFRQVVVQAHKTNAAFKPSPITTRLQTIAKHMRHGRQEDSHEFLRYAIDAMQKSLLHDIPPKLEAKLSETTWIYKIFGGKLRSRVSCKSCGHNSDTFDRILDLSVDILKADSLKEALRGFIAPDFLKGADKYKCEKCKKHVNAEKRFTIHDAPAVLTVHLKRFSPLGRKIGHHVTYEETLHLQPFMSKESFGPTYSLYGVICHAGGGPNSGHYFAFVKSRTGKWFEMNDEMVSPISGPPVNKKAAYILFYIRNKGQGMQALLRDVNGSAVDGGEKKPLIAGMKKRREREEEEEEDIGERVNLDEDEEEEGVVNGKGKGKEMEDKGFIGPLLPSPIPKLNGTPDAKRVKFEHHGILGSSSNGVVKKEKGKKDDPQAEKLKQKISALREAKAKKALAVLDSYNSSTEGSDADGDELIGEINGKGKQKEEDSDIEDEDGSSSPAKPPPSSPVPNSATKTSKFKIPSSPISTTNFYGPPKRAAPLRPPSPTSSPSADSDNDNDDNDDNEQQLSTPSRGLSKKERKKQLKKEKQKLRMSMENGLSSSTSSHSLLGSGKSGRGYINPFSRIGSENAVGSGKGIINTYGKRKNRRPRGL